MQTVRITTSQNITIDYEVAGLGERMLAHLIDYGIFFILLMFGFFLFLPLMSTATASIVYIYFIILYVLFLFYDLVCEIFMNGQSIGKRVMKIKVVSLDGAQPAIGQYLLRWLFRLVDMTLTSGVCALVSIAASGKSQRLGDMVAGTTVIKTQPRSNIDQVAYMPVADATYVPVFKEAAQLSDKDIALIHEVVYTYMKTGNNIVVYNMANKIKDHLLIQIPETMNSLQFLKTIVQDYNHIGAQDMRVN